jgi:hypothetical protein
MTYSERITLLDVFRFLDGSSVCRSLFEADSQKVVVEDPSTTMRVISGSTILALTTLHVGFIDTSAFLPFNGGRSRTKSKALSPSAGQIAFLMAGNGNGNNGNGHRRRSGSTALSATSESAAAAQAAFMSAAPLLLAPLAALAYGSQALTAKQQLELDLAATEIRLDDIKEQTRRTQLQATVRTAIYIYLLLLRLLV